MIPRIQKIISVEPYKVVCLWSTGEIRVVDLENTLRAKSTAQNSSFAPLLEPKRFQEVQLDQESATIYWAEGSTMLDYDGSRKPAPLDFCPDVLYEMSTLLNSKISNKKIL